MDADSIMNIDRKASPAEPLDDANAASGGGEPQPADADPVFAGIGQQIRALRKRRHLTLEEVAVAAGMTIGYLSQIERGLAVPTLTALKRVADGLGVRLADFFQGEELAAPYGLVRRDERPDFHHPISGQIYQQLTPTWNGRMHALYSLVPGEQTERRSHAGEEFALVLEGEIEYRIGIRCYRMSAGDSLYFDCFQAHCVVNIGDTVARWIWVSAPSL
jgi:transcriptional regulator with XRE-family HTH domain